MYEVMLSRNEDTKDYGVKKQGDTPQSKSKKEQTPTRVNQVRRKEEERWPSSVFGWEPLGNIAGRTTLERK